MSQFNQDLATGKYKDKVQKDLTDGTAIGVNATPTFYLNGKKLSLFSFTDLDAEVAKALK
ncbi:MAG: Protein-disulfide isomerase [Candidatus Gottesmanbacteria bacterium GW2011_GWB1_43_11]|uniref:Protein-disulfide isomerase n=1 Tax=Candidatus Gottesmanbacteria bacterium GW2011_GWB1_43_11 TaxID=1618446 RepID=A0A0G1CNL7_9BACT|nr:MAG: Protein-disulfide isomerase [Candidatus Gottesmanbacteria bacterium GW2011_GWB1_43_11]